MGMDLRWQRFVAADHDQHPPQGSLNEDGHRRAGSEPVAVRHLRPVPRTLRQVVDARRLTGTPDLLGGAVTSCGRAHADLDAGRRAVEGRDLGRSVGFEPQQRTEVDVGQSGGLSGHRREYLVGGYVLGGELGHRSQGGLFVGQ